MPLAFEPLTRVDIQAVNNLSGVQQLLTRLGYDTGDPVEQTPAALGIAARVAPALRHVWRVATVRGPGLPLELYCLESRALTADLRKAVVSAFRNKPVQALFLFTTTDYDPLDFVLLEKAPGQGTTGRVEVSYQLFSVERRAPSPVQLRVLNRLSNTAGDPFAQYERIRDALRLAEWSEDEFNNRNLFSDYFLQNRLRDGKAFPAWETDVGPALRRLNELLMSVQRSAANWHDLDEQQLHTTWIAPILDALGFQATRTHGAADMLLRPQAGATTDLPLAALLLYPWDRALDRQDDNDRSRPDHVPGIRVIQALEQERVPWAILSNGKDWRLYCAAAHSRATNYYEVDLPDSIGRQDPVGFRYFYLFFRAAAFVQGGDGVCFLEQVRRGSEAFAKEIGDRLRQRVFDEVFPYLAEGFIEDRRARLGERTAAGAPFLADVYDATLTLLYRLLFLLYAEALDLLPIHQSAYAALSLTRLKQEVKEAAGPDADTVEKQLKARHSRSETGRYENLTKLFQIIDSGSSEHNVPEYNGGLFRMDPREDDESREARAARFLAQYRVPDFYLAYAIDLLARGEDPKSHELVFVDYKALGVRQLGSIYEGLLMYHVVLPRDDWERQFRRPRLRIALVPSNKERKSTGSYFTPAHIVKYIVESTVGPLLEGKFAAAAPQLRAAQRDYAAQRDFQRNKAARLKQPPPAADVIARDVLVKYEDAVWELFDLKVLDPAMGSGHFLVETVDFITDRMLHFLAGFPWNPVQVLVDLRIRRQILESLDRQEVTVDVERLTDVNLIKRLVMKRCVYGVDLNPMAVELAKVSLWLDSFTLGAPLSFLDHHLKHGNSLIGASIEDLKEATRERLSKKDKVGLMFAIPMEPLERATRLMEQVAHLSDATVTEVRQSAEIYDSVLAGVEGYRVLLDCLTAEHFGVEGASTLVSYGGDLDLAHWPRTLQGLSARDRGWVEKAEAVSRARAFLHWDVQFPDVFFTAKRAVEQRRFDAVVGNPPYVSAWVVEAEDRTLRRYVEATYHYQAAHWDLYTCFLERAITVSMPSGFISFIIPLGFLGQKYGKPLRQFLLSQGRWHTIADYTAVRVFPEADTKSIVPIIGSPTPGAQLRVELFHEHDGSEVQMVETWTLSPESILGRPEVDVRLELTAAAAQIADKLASRSIPVKAVAYVNAGAVSHSSKLKKGKADFVHQEKRNAKCKRFVDAKDIDRYEVWWKGLYLEYDRDVLHIPMFPELFEAAKILVRDITWIGARLRCAYDREGFYCTHTLTCVVPYHELKNVRGRELSFTTEQLELSRRYSPHLCLAVLASALTDWYFGMEMASETLQGPWSHLYPRQVEALPLPRLAPTAGTPTPAGPDFEPYLSKAVPAEAGQDHLEGVVCQCAEAMAQTAANRLALVARYTEKLGRLAGAGSITKWTGFARLEEPDYLGWDARYPDWHPDAETVADGRWFPNGVAPPLPGNGPEGFPWDLIARVYPSYPLPGIDHAAWEAAAWDEFCELLRKNKSKIGNTRLRADLTGSGRLTEPTGPLRELRDLFLRYHREVRENRARAAEIDFLIDRIVFRLFELTPEEQRLILARVGPGRPLPPRRKKRAKPDR